MQAHVADVGVALTKLCPVQIHTCEASPAFLSCQLPAARYESTGCATRSTRGVCTSARHWNPMVAVESPHATGRGERGGTSRRARRRVRAAPVRRGARTAGREPNRRLPEVVLDLLHVAAVGDEQRGACLA